MFLSVIITILGTYLSVKGIVLQVVIALELPSVRLGHHKGISISLKDLSLVSFLKPTSCKVPFPDDWDTCTPFIWHSQSCGFCLVCIYINYKREPHLCNVLLCKGVQGGFFFQIQIFHPVFFPTKIDLKLQMDGVGRFFYVHHLFQDDGDADVGWIDPSIVCSFNRRDFLVVIVFKNNQLTSILIRLVSAVRDLVAPPVSSESGYWKFEKWKVKKKSVSLLPRCESEMKMPWDRDWTNVFLVNFYIDLYLYA